MNKPSNEDTKSEATEQSAAGFAIADQIAFNVLEAAENCFDVSLHYVVGSIKCPVNPDAISLYLASKHASVLFIMDAQGRVWLLGSPIGNPQAPARRILATDDPDMVSLYCLELLSGADRGLAHSAGTRGH